MATWFVRDNATMELLDIVEASDREQANEQALVLHGPEIVVYSTLQDEFRSAESLLGGDE